ncbi:MAG: ComEC/Rec2 family competence protein [Bacteroidales bacterium]|nr:ComEC/Rec2 family competence protein [Bacteroidales bacterium]
MKTIPLLRFFFPFAAGIYLSDIFASRAPEILIPALYVFFLLLLLLVITYRKLHAYSLRWVGGLITYLIMMNLAIIVSTYTYASFYHNHYSTYSSPEQFLAKISDYAIQKKKSYRITAEIISVKDSNGWHPVSGKILVYIEKDSTKKCPEPNDIITFCANPQFIGNTGNPGNFNYQKYMFRRGITQRAYIKSEQWEKHSRQSTFGLYLFAQDIRHRMLTKLKQQGISGDEYAVASAILLGYDDYLEPELRKNYSGSGAMHILCVSGLHVGIIFAIATLLLSFLVKLKNGKKIRAIIILLIIWIFAFITGLSPSVTRAACMFSFVSIGMIFSRETPIYNTLIASAFFILLIKPLFLFEIGFQLSYAAVLGIVSIQPVMADLWKTNYKSVKYFRDLILVSLAAQAGTFALSVYYFHQFPNYFLLTNVLVIPMSFIVMICGIVSLGAMWIPFIGIYMVKLLAFTIKALNTIVGGIEDLPFSVSRNLYINTGELILLMLFLTFIIFWMNKKSPRMLLSSAVLFCLLLMSVAMRQINVNKQFHLMVYNTPGYFSADIVKGKTASNLSDAALIKNPSVDLYLSGTRVVQGVSRIKIDTSSLKALKEENSKMCILNAGNRKIIIYGRGKAKPSDTCDIAIICHDAQERLLDISQRIKAGIYVLDGSNKPWRIRRWLEEAEEHKIPVHDLSQMGAYKAPLSARE